MKKTIKHILILVLIFCVGQVSAQNLLEFNQYFQNKEILNPSLAGRENMTIANVGFRQQWSGFDGSPQTFYVAGHSPLKKYTRENLTYEKNSLRISTPRIYDRIYDSEMAKAERSPKHGIGGYVYVTDQGHFSTWKAAATYAFHYPISNKWKASAGLSAVFNNIEPDKDLVVKNPNDATYQQYLDGANERRLQVNMGVSAYTDHFYIGYGVLNLAKVSVVEDILDSNENLMQHVFMTGATFEVYQNIRLAPEIMAYYGTNEEFGYNLNARGFYKDLGYMGVSWRNDDYVGFLFGVKATDKINISYAYEQPLNEIKNASKGNGAHEIGLGIKF
ncbi:PorP/SprF family type IX secretion system membrane protein [Aureibacter tunicatorum]|uniref:Type IX secretion system PorP/SprF family membrane protein n=1 Tax=Aureibacter tunicatorum TaxID=866807 RepID=A0AAE3XNJ2_9BACT|nr:type IX secretion system membrane protein PorP/SprF [Aureibacter tunicatorum]MDR6239159.1 type IX secretion system PorP/SprF family membrane protein [Aureibacter tunicatorum]BDD04915.1 hypothetical protein AUTU_23980 [Aureibacter tunicatorum]